MAVAWGVEDRLYVSVQAVCEFLYNGELLQVKLTRDGERISVCFSGTTHEYALHELSHGKLALTSSSDNSRARVARTREKVWVWVDGYSFEFRTPFDDLSSDYGAQQAEDEARAPMPGTIVKLFVKEGDSVDSGQVLAILEAMKMEHTLKAPRAGTVQMVRGAVGTTVDAGALVVQLAVD